MARNKDIKHALAILMFGMMFGMLVCSVIAKLHENNLFEEFFPPIEPELESAEDKDKLIDCIENCARDYVFHPVELIYCMEACHSTTKGNMRPRRHPQASLASRIQDDNGSSQSDLCS
ncbi:hypothetical protein PIB30_024548 [Stylosanthes scabra]|uniref:Uncharacterized protein n=1 Tax=Stylosanthes scabra TaxID=79078 RepID=A0ABU6SAG0_9FABA|nr:hypothetical protein [Stylosanthes scabra]